MKTEKYITFINEVLDITKNVEGSALSTEIDEVINKYSDYLFTTPLPTSIVKWVTDLIELMNNVEGAELERELSELKTPIKRTKSVIKASA